jgi:hypothetical protein
MKQGRVPVGRRIIDQILPLVIVRRGSDADAAMPACRFFGIKKGRSEATPSYTAHDIRPCRSLGSSRW